MRKSNPASFLPWHLRLKLAWDRFRCFVAGHVEPEELDLTAGGSAWQGAHCPRCATVLKLEEVEVTNVTDEA